VFDSNGVPYAQTSVFLYQGDGPAPGGKFAEWMPFQLGQAALTAKLLESAAIPAIQTDQADSKLTTVVDDSNDDSAAPETGVVDTEPGPVDITAESGRG